MLDVIENVLIGAAPQTKKLSLIFCGLCEKISRYLLAMRCVKL